MCGIAGWISFQRDLEGEGPVLRAMNDTMVCRGPDAEGAWLSRHAALGHRRLSVIDLEGGVQPMVAETDDGPVVLTYSGEAYNYTELRAELRRRGHEFRTASDTEVVLRGYLEWGPGVADRLNGMYALGIWDGRTERLVLLRDRLGIKPLHYHLTKDGVVFGSEAKTVLAHPLVEPVVDTDGFRELFGFVKTPGRSVWANLREVRPGTVVTVDRGGVREHVYWTLEAKEHRDDTETTVRRIRELLDDTVARQLVADVPQCVLLSGGLDSSALTALAGRHLATQGKQARTFTVDFVQSAEFTPDDLHETQDAPFARDVVRHVGTVHQDIRLDHRQLADPAVRRAVVAARDLPFGFGEADNSLYLLFKAIREHSTVALSGESADEVFGGYPWFHIPAVQEQPMFPWVTASSLDPSGHPTKLIDPELLLHTLDVPGYWAQRYADSVAAVPEVPGEDAHERRMREFCHVHLTSLLPMLLDRKDRMSMAVGLEVRVPFCDHRIVEYVYNTPWAMKTHDGREKSLLRAATADVLPRSVVERVKALYPRTQELGYVSALQAQVSELLAEDHQAVGFFDGAALREAAHGAPEAVRRDARDAFERVLDLAVWLDVRRPVVKLT
ncbi:MULTISPECIES: asparagine synthase (glutamine-hydrolyzing) [Streptomyces]|uniref:asparagine synthase (glutamine-hydrolyzing) n=1 Tax=Streptomyces TaxID=1883 RepID=UPI00163D0211|nr:MULTISPECIES: asparagine synthase (glutamine-hydrolyzing) [Streptomyces]MBC2874322.1 asparagine synthase (glutamine-hydrolyzing) [Streptomyces sp. TYQ1024]UBI40357.1 asparagine synthase (glutamine-hydrolyzing) [Streptomyces mobaraensis]UKW32937.1 asparagine synthase (glutamine-hydrolyzing) [Streptomyces sp. TYQ1024]